MKKSLMSNIKNFVDSNVRHRIDRVAHNNNEFFGDDLIQVERHFEDLRQVCIDTEKKISTLLQSIQVNSSSSHLGTYSQNVQAGLSSLSQNISQPSSSLSASISVMNSNQVQQSTGNDADQTIYRCSNESLISNNHTSSSNNNLVSTLKHQPASVDLSALDQQFSEDIQQRYKKLPIVGFLRFLVKTSHKLKPDSLLAVTLAHCAQLQTQLTKLFLNHEQTIEIQCLKPIQHILEVDIPNVVKLRKLFIKSHNDLESFRVKYNGANQKQQQHVQQQQQQTQHTSTTSYTVNQTSAQQINANKIEQLKKELDEALTRFEQARDAYEAEIYGFVCRETELVNLIVRFYHLQTDYHQQVGAIIQNSLPTLTTTLACTPRKFAFGTALDEHLRCTGRTIAPVLELCVHLLYSQGLKEEGLFRIPGSSIKIKKLKNAINAWFVNLTSLNELENDQSRQSGHACVVALHDLFKNVVGKPPELVQQSNSKSDVFVDGDELPASQQGHDQQLQHRDSEILLDVHSIAGLLKLYLRELPEPLFTYALYDQWIDALNATNTTNTQSSNNDQQQNVSTGQKQRNEMRCKALAEVIGKLPSCNYKNLEHLIRFLHLLTCNQQFNKMTSTNLAIAMAPSLIWSKPAEIKAEASIDGDTLTAQQSLSMSSFGISASLHAMLLDALISNAETLFPQSSDFTMPGFKDLSLAASKHRESKRGSERPLKSTSPAGLSIASSSSFSSNTSNPTVPNATNLNSLAIKTHSRKGGSMDGLLGVCNDGDQDNIIAFKSSATSSGEATLGRLPTRVQRGNAFKSSRPVSVQIRREDYATLGEESSNKTQAPPVPPVPLARSHIRQLTKGDSKEPRSLHGNRLPLQKPAAPPVPPPTSLRHQQERLKAAVVESSSSASDAHEEGQKPVTAPRPVSLRGTGTISSNTMPDSIHNNINAIRPTVPPPQRPSIDLTHTMTSKANTDGTMMAAKYCDRKSLTKTTTSVDAKAIGAKHVSSVSSPSPPLQIATDRNDGKSISPAISLDSITVASDASASSGSLNEDSSFDEVNAIALEIQQRDGCEFKQETGDKFNGPILAHNADYLPDSMKKQNASVATTEVVAATTDGDRNIVSEKSLEPKSNFQKVSQHIELEAEQQAHSSNVVDPTSSDNSTTGPIHHIPPPARPPRSVSPKTATSAQRSQTLAQQQQSTPL